MNRNPIKTLLCLLAVFIVTAAQAIVIRHDQDDIKYQQLTKQYTNSITYNDGCVGTVIDPSWVLTAAHCIVEEQQRPFFVTHLAVNYPVESIELHPKYNPQTNNHDMALLRLKWPMKNAQPALLYPASNEIGKKVTFVGNGDFGNGREGLTSNKSILRAATNIVTDSTSSQISFIFDHPANALTLEGISGPHDSGGPAFIEEQGKLYVAGVSSWQSNDGKEGVYGVVEHYARVSTQRQWINNTILQSGTIEDIAHPLLRAIKTKSFFNLRQHLSDTDWKKSPALIRALLIELSFKLSPNDAKTLLEQIPELASLKLNNVRLPSYVIELRNWGLFETLVQFPINIQEQNSYGESYLTQLLMLSPLEMNLEPLLNVLLARGLDINSTDDRGNTALALAVYLANRDDDYTRVDLLLRKGANPNIGDLENYSPLMYIASVGNEELMSLFVKHGALINTKDNSGKTALDYATSNNHLVVRKFLETKLKEQIRLVN